MASPVDTTIKWFTSKMLGAPVLRGQAGSLIAILDACLVNGWGVQVASSCVVSGGVCTLTFPLDHAAPVDTVILVEGASIAALNGEQKVTATAPNVVKFATAAANGTATGTITAKMAPAGYAKPFSGTNLAVYKSLSVAGNGHFCRVNDANALYARANAYETMTAVSTGTGLAPTATQISGGIYWHKSLVANAAPLDWYCVSDGRMFYFGNSSYQANDIGGNAGPYASSVSGPIFGFGDPIPKGSAPDPFSTMLFGGVTSGNGYSSSTLFQASYSASNWNYVLRVIAGTGTAQGLNCLPYSGSLAAEPVLDSASGRIRVSKIYGSTDTTQARRVDIPGIYMSDATYLEKALTHLTTFKIGNPERTHLATLSADSVGQVSATRLVSFDITGPWR